MADSSRSEVGFEALSGASSHHFRARIFCGRRAGASTETVARPPPLRLTQARIGDTLHDGNGTRVAIVNAFTTVDPETVATVSRGRLPGRRYGSRPIPHAFGRRARRRLLAARRDAGAAVMRDQPERVVLPDSDESSTRRLIVTRW